MMRRFIDLISGKVVVKLLMVSLSVFGGALLLLFTIVEIRNYQIARRALVEDLNLLTETSLAPLASALWEYDIDRLNAFLPDIEILRFVQGVSIEDTSGNVIAMRGNIVDTPQDHEFIAREKLVFQFGDNTRELGFVTIYATDKGIFDRIIDDIKNDAFIFVVLLIIVSALVVFIANVFFGKPLRLLEIAIERFRRDGVRKPVEWTSQDELGHIVSAFNAMQLRQQETETQLMDALSDLTAARERERAQQSEYSRVARLTTMGAMAASIAHEVNQPLAAIVTNSNAAQRWLSRPQPDIDEARSSLEKIARDGHRASEVIAGIRSMFRQDAGNQKRHEDINAIIGEVLEFLQPDIARHEISLELSLSEDLPEVSVNRVQIQQVILNLLTNAVEATRPVSTRRRWLHVRSSLRDHFQVAIAIEDSGPGIDRDKIDRIFEPFVTSKATGMGMGLSICRSIVESHGGQISATRGNDFGSVFEVVLPAE